MPPPPGCAPVSGRYKKHINLLDMLKKFLNMRIQSTAGRNCVLLTGNSARVKIMFTSWRIYGLIKAANWSRIWKPSPRLKIILIYSAVIFWEDKLTSVFMKRFCLQKNLLVERVNLNRMLCIAAVSFSMTAFLGLFHLFLVKHFYFVYAFFISSSWYIVWYFTLFHFCFTYCILNERVPLRFYVIHS